MNYELLVSNKTENQFLGQFIMCEDKSSKLIGVKTGSVLTSDSRSNFINCCKLANHL